MTDEAVQPSLLHDISEKGFAMSRGQAVAAEGARVAGTKKERRYRVYVIRLENSVWAKSRKFREANPQSESGRPHVYVGSTGKTPEERFKAHKRGGKGSSRLVKRFGKRLFVSEYENLPTFKTRAAAEALEKKTAEEIRSRGWGVWYNADPLGTRLKPAADNS